MSETIINIIGQHPETGENIYVRSRSWQTGMKLARENNLRQILLIGLGEDSSHNRNNCKHFFLPKNMKVEDITPEVALSLLSLPRYIGRHPITGGRIEANLNIYGAYIAHHFDSKIAYISKREHPVYRSLLSFEDVLNINLDQATIILSEPNKIPTFKRQGEIFLLDSISFSIPSSNSTSLDTVKEWFSSLKTVEEWKKELSSIKNWSEKKESFIQVAISRYLELQGIRNEMEVYCDENNNYRADITILDRKTVVEVKKIIDKKSILQGVTQVRTYAKMKKMTYKILVGMPGDRLKRKQIDRLIKLHTEWDLKIHVLDLSRRDLGLDKIFEIGLKKPHNLFSKLLEFSEILFQVIIDTTKTFFQTPVRDQLQLNPS